MCTLVCDNKVTLDSSGFQEEPELPKENENPSWVPAYWPMKRFHPFAKKDERCLLDDFFEAERRKPPHLRSNSAMISCPCSKCNPARL